MPQNGEQNRKLGFYKCVCCGKEIVVPEGNEFPDCPNHPGLTTVWKSIVGDTIIQFGKTGKADFQHQFKLGDQVSVGTGRLASDTGYIECIDGSFERLRRYHVRLADGSLLKCFGFELELVRKQSAKTA